MTRVLLVEDSKTQARLVEGMLQDEGFDVTVLYDGRSALQAALIDPPDLVLTDVLMPELDGFELCKALRSNAETAEVPIVVMTSLVQPNDVLHALGAGADGYIGKPVDATVLLGRIRRVLGLRATPPGALNLEGEIVTVHASRETILSVLTCALEDAAARQNELATSRKRLEQAKAQQDEIMGVVAHELRTPLNVLALRASLEAQREQTPQQPEASRMASTPTETGKPTKSRLPPFSDLVARNVRAMAAIVEDLLDVARIESGAIRVSPRLADIRPLMRDVAARFAAVSESHPIHVETPDEPVVVFHDTGRIEQVLANLVGNAIKYSPDGGGIELRVRHEGEFARIEIQDEGMGLPEGFEERLFGRYVRAPGSERVAKGVGLGLYICRRLAELHGGQIGVERPPRGTVFWFTLSTQPVALPTATTGETKPST